MFVRTFTFTAVAAFAVCTASPTWADGAAVYQANCAKCHGETGKADTPIATAMKVPPLAGDANVQKMSVEDVAKRIKDNAKHPPTIKALSDADITASAEYVKQLAGGK